MFVALYCVRPLFYDSLRQTLQKCEGQRGFDLIWLYKQIPGYATFGTANHLRRHFAAQLPISDMKEITHWVREKDGTILILFLL